MGLGWRQSFHSFWVSLGDVIWDFLTVPSGSFEPFSISVDIFSTSTIYTINVIPADVEVEKVAKYLRNQQKLTDSFMKKKNIFCKESHNDTKLLSLSVVYWCEVLHNNVKQLTKYCILVQSWSHEVLHNDAKLFISANSLTWIFTYQCIFTNVKCCVSV